jgi:tRNA-splicing ligase RtcB
MDLARLKQRGEAEWMIPRQDGMRVPVVLYGSRMLLQQMDDKVYRQAVNVASLPGIVGASYAMPDAQWGGGFPAGGVVAFDPRQGGIVSAGGVGFDISCGVRLIQTGLRSGQIAPGLDSLLDDLVRRIPAGLGSRGHIRLSEREMDSMLFGGARWAVECGWGDAQELTHIEEQGCMAGAEPEQVSVKARLRQRDAMGTLGSGNYYLQIQVVDKLYDYNLADRFGLSEDDVVISIHCGSRGLGHQVGSEFMMAMARRTEKYKLPLADRELAYAPADSRLGRQYLGAMRAATNCALANRQIIGARVREAFEFRYPLSEPRLVYDVSYNTCKQEVHLVDGQARSLLVHRKGATRALAPGHPDLPPALKETGQPVFIGGSMGTSSYVLSGLPGNADKSFSSACHGAGRAMSRRQALRRWSGREIIDDLSRRGIRIRCASHRGVAEEAPQAYKDVTTVVKDTEQAGLARRVARLRPLGVIKG